MKAQSDPITPDEWLLRIIWHDKFVSTRTPIISPRAFEPRGPKAKKPDDEGISLFRLACLPEPSDVLVNIAADKRPANGIAGLTVADLTTLGFTVGRKDHEPEVGQSAILGHVVVPELTWALYAANPSAFTPRLLALAMLASRDGSIFVRPAPPQ